MMYKFARNAIVEVTKNPDNIDSIRAKLIRQTIGLKNNGMEYNRSAFDTFVKHFLPMINCLSCDLMTTAFTKSRIPFGQMQLVGGPHMIVKDSHGYRRFIYLHPSRDWDKDEIDAFCEMLCFVIDTLYGAKPSELWFIDLAEGKIIPYPRSKKTVRKRCIETADLLRQLLDHEDLDFAA